MHFDSFLTAMAIQAVTTVFLAGVTYQTVKDHGRRIEKLEERLDSIFQRDHPQKSFEFEGS